MQLAPIPNYMVHKWEVEIVVAVGRTSKKGPHNASSRCELLVARPIRGRRDRHASEEQHNNNWD